MYSATSLTMNTDDGVTTLENIQQFSPAHRPKKAVVNIL